MRKFIFKDTEKNTELVLPVTPPSFEVSHGIKMETVNIYTLGDVNIAGYGTLTSFKVECLLPAHSYPFLQAPSDLTPYQYIEAFERWCDARTVLRFIVSETMVNVLVLIEEISYGEKDGTADVYATLSLRKYRQLSAVQTSKTGNSSRSTETAAVKPETYLIKSGDTLSAICRKVYGDASLYSKLAKYNGIKNPNLIYAGNTIKLPDRSQL